MSKVKRYSTVKFVATMMLWAAGGYIVSKEGGGLMFLGILIMITANSIEQRINK